MKLAEALQERADIEQLRARLNINATVQEGEKPAEEPAALLREMDACFERMEALMGTINVVNCKTVVNGLSITQMIARKDCLRIRIQAYRDLIQSASNLSQRAMRTEIKIVRTVDVQALQKAVDDLSKELREIDNRIQSTNWTTDI